MKSAKLALCAVMAVSMSAYGADKKKMSADDRARSRDYHTYPSDLSSRADRDAEVAAEKSSDLDRQFLNDFARENRLLARLGELADKQASNHAVQAFGKLESDRHTDMQQRLTDLAKSKNIDLSHTLEGMQAITLHRFRNLSGDAFDQAYMSRMLLEHNMLVSNFRYMMDNASDPDIKKFARDILPGLEDHLRVAQDDADKIKLDIRSSDLSR